MSDSKLNVVLHRDGDQSPVSIDQDKCLIRTIHDNQKIDCCAIFNGPCGTALRSYTDNVLVNGEPTAARWLNAGDQIQLPCSTRIEVKAATRLKTALLKPTVKAPEVTAASEVEVLETETSAPEASVAVAEPPVQVAEAPVAPAVEETQVETFHSPFSDDLPEIEAQSVASEPVADADAPNAETPNDPAAPAELASIFARMGVTNVGSIANPGAVADSSAIADASQPAAENSQVETPTVTPVPETELPSPVVTESPQQAQPEQNADSEEAENVRRELHAMFGDVPGANPTPVQEAVSSVEVASPFESTVSTESTVSVEPQIEATPIEATPQANVAEGLSSPTEQPASDPLAELPDDLRNQLNDLVSSLENESPKASQNVPASEGLPATAAVASAAVAATAAVSAAVLGSKVETETETVSQPPTEALFSETQVASKTVSEEAKPVRDESISSMFEDTMRAIQGESQSPAVGSVESVSPVQPSAGLESIQAAVETPAVAETPAKPEPESRSVTDILGAMGMAVPGQEEMETADPQAAVPVAPTPQPEPVQTQSAVPVFSGANNATVEAPAAADSGGGDAEDDIQAYMNQLLNRAKPDSAPVVGTCSLANTPLAPKVVEKKEIPKVLSEEEFVPTHKATRPENYDSLREIANTSSRTAVNHSNRRAKKAHVMFKLISGLIALCLAGAAFWLGQHAMSGILAVVAVLCFVLCSLSDDSKAQKEAAAAALADNNTE